MKYPIMRPLICEHFKECKSVSEPVISRVKGSNEEYNLVKLVMVRLITDKGELEFDIPKSFTFDGASIPRFFWRIIGHPFQGKVLRGALVHDFLYASELVYRKEADMLFRDILAKDGMKFLKRNIIYFTVRAFGWIVWNRHKEEEIVLLRVKTNLRQKFHGEDK